MRETTLPTELRFLEGKTQYVQQVNRTEWSGNCPQCGGNVHKGGELPDRFRMFTNANGKNKVLGWCRRCSYVAFPDTSRPLSPSEMEAWRQDQIEREKARKRSAEAALENLRSEKLWIKYHDMLGELGLSTLKDWGIRKDWADYWRLGLFPDYQVRNKTEQYFSPAITIPMWQYGSPVPGNIKLRILNPKSSNDRYRALYKTGKAFAFVAFNKLRSDSVVLVEGEKKAMVVAEWSEQKYQVVGLPSVTPDSGVLANFANYGTIYVCLDPDSRIKDQKGVSPITRLVDLLGRDVANIALPDKVDDMINRGMRFDSAMRLAKTMKPSEAL